MYADVFSVCYPLSEDLAFFRSKSVDDNVRGDAFIEFHLAEAIASERFEPCVVRRRCREYDGPEPAVAAEFHPLGGVISALVAGVVRRELYGSALKAAACKDSSLLEGIIISLYDSFKFHVVLLSYSTVRMMMARTFCPPPKPRRKTVFGCFLTWWAPASPRIWRTAS